MLKGHLFATCSSGLCNRMLVLAGSWRIAERTGKEFSVYWPKNDQLGCAFDQLFSNPFRMIADEEIHRILGTGRTLKVYNAWRHGPLYTEMADDGDPEVELVIIKGWSYPKFMSEPYGPELYHEICRYLALLRPRAEVLAEAGAFPLPPTAVGVHLRRGDPCEEFQQSRDAHFQAIMERVAELCPEVRFLLATDDARTESAFRELFGRRVMAFPKTRAARTEARTIQEALIDLLLLSRTAIIIGTNYSSFSHTAGKLGRKDVLIANETSAGRNLEESAGAIATAVRRAAERNHAAAV